MEKLRSILLIDDDEVTNFLNQELMSDLQLAQQVETLTDARQALELVEDRCSQGQGPDLILLDLKMPVFSGFDFLSSFQKLPSSMVQHIKIIVLTTSNNPKDIQRLQDLGIENVLNKPLTKEKILNLV